MARENYYLIIYKPIFRITVDNVTRDNKCVLEQIIGQESKRIQNLDAIAYLKPHYYHINYIKKLYYVDYIIRKPHLRIICNI